MLLNKTSFLYPSTSTKFRYQKCYKTTTLPFNYRYEKPEFLMGRNVGKMAVLQNEYPYLPTLEQPEIDHVSDNTGIGILEFYQGKNILVTGATGLLGKVIVEKLLRSTSVDKVYLLINAKDKDAALQRLSKEIVNSDLFESLKDKHGKYYERFVKSKVIPIVGNICEPNLGMDSNDADTVKRDVHVIIGSAASTDMNNRYDLILETNVNAPQLLMMFAKTCENLKLFTHISTAYVNGRRKGIIPEKPWTFGENGKDVDEIVSSLITPRDDYPMDAATELKLALESLSCASTAYEAAIHLKRLGKHRAEYFGWNNVYQLTKAMGEMTLNESRGYVPLLILRPTIIESTYKSPFPGWIQGNRMVDPMIIAFAKGQLPGYLADPGVCLDVMPADMVADTTLAAIAKHGAMDKPQVNVYHIGSGVVNPVTSGDIFEFAYESFSKQPVADFECLSRMKFFNNFNDVSKYLREELSRRSVLRQSDGHIDQQTIRKMQNRSKATASYAEHLCKIYEFVFFFKATFDTGNTQKLLREMSEEEKLEFEIDATKIEWRKYFNDIHIPGLRKHVINGTN